MKRVAFRVVIATALVGFGWIAGQAAQPQADFEIAVSSPNGSTTITCRRGCGLQFIRYAPQQGRSAAILHVRLPEPRGTMRRGGSGMAEVSRSPDLYAFRF